MVNSSSLFIQSGKVCFGIIFSIVSPLKDKILWVVVPEGGDEGGFIGGEAGFEIEMFFGLFFHFFIEVPDGDIHWADALAFAAVDASSGEVEGADEVVEYIFGEGGGFLNPLNFLGFFFGGGIGFDCEIYGIYDAFFAVAHGAYGAAGVTADAFIHFCFPCVPPGLGVEGFDFFEGLIIIPVFFLNGVSKEYVMYNGVIGFALDAAVGEEFFGGDAVIAGAGTDDKIVILAEGDGFDLCFFVFPGYFFYVHDACFFAGETDDIDIVSCDILFLDEYVDGAGVAAFGENGDGAVVGFFLRCFLSFFV